MRKFDVIVVGAGAAGMMCAIEAGKRGRSVLLIDHAKRMGEKIRISGGGKCNFTNLDVTYDKFISQNPRFATSCLSRYTQWDFIDWIAHSGIAYHEKTLGQLFCDGSSKEILGMIDGALMDAGVTVELNTTLNGVAKSDDYSLKLSSGVVHCDSLVIATGGKSIPKIGATGIGYQLAEQFGLSIIETRPGLVPLTFAHQELQPIKAMAGTSVQARVTCDKASFEEGLLFTHRGLSGPSILQISSYWREGDEISVNLARGMNVLNALKTQRQTKGKQAIHNALAQQIPASVAQFATVSAGVSGNLADQSDQALTLLADAVHAWKIKPVGSEGYRTAEVTIGGVNTDDLDARTMQAKNVAGLYFIGEVVDVTGWLGGYNFQWAWSSGWAAGQVA
jgi:predicted Rossmann fold flavoprotein